MKYVDLVKKIKRLPRYYDPLEGMNRSLATACIRYGVGEVETRVTAGIVEEEIPLSPKVPLLNRAPSPVKIEQPEQSLPIALTATQLKHFGFGKRENEIIRQIQKWDVNQTSLLNARSAILFESIAAKIRNIRKTTSTKRR